MKNIIKRNLLLILIFALQLSFCKEKVESEISPDPALKPNAEYLYVKEKEGTHMFQMPDTESEKIEFLPKASRLELVEVTDEYSTVNDKEGLWAKVFFNKFEGYVFMPFTQSHPPLNIDYSKDRVYTCITYSNQPIESDSIDYFILRSNGILEHLWINEDVLNEGLDIRYFRGKYEESSAEVNAHSKKDYKLFKYQDGHILLTEENLKRIQREPEIRKRLEKQLDLFETEPVKVQESFWFCQRSKKLDIE